VPNHAGDAQAALGNHTVFVEMAAVEVRVGDDGTPPTPTPISIFANRGFLLCIFHL
jgi:hypothetical protein